MPIHKVPPRVALVQRSIPHYRLPLFRALSSDERFKWTFFCNEHDDATSSGLGVAIDDLHHHPLRVKKLVEPLIWQSGIPIHDQQFDALMVDYGWTILSNPVLFARARAKGIATIGWSKGISQSLETRKSPIRRKLEKASISLCDALVVYGDISRDYFLDLGVPEGKIFVARNTIDTFGIASRASQSAERGRRLREQLAIGNEPIIGFMGKIGPAKRVDCLIQAFEIAAQRGMKGIFLIVGQGPSTEAIDLRIEASPVRHRIIRIKDVPPGEEDAVFQCMDAYVSYAQAGLGILEAMAHGTPIIATPDRYPETELLENDRTAFLSSEASVEAFAIRLAQAVNDPAARDRIARAARARVLDCATIENMVEQIWSAVTYGISQRKTDKVSRLASKTNL